MKNIVFCADGTWNGITTDNNNDGIADVTNVLKVYRMLKGEDSAASVRLQDEAERTYTDASTARQVAKYLHGVGDSSNPIVKILGGVFGDGLIARIVRGYTFISRNYEGGDKIFIIGFSRGAYTARALAGMIAAVGLLNRRSLDLDGDRELAYTLGISAWRSYRQMAAQAQPNPTIANKIADVIASMPGCARMPLRDGDLIKGIPIEAVAVWDTVGSLGIPLTDDEGHLVDAFRFADTQLSSVVRNGIHAVSLDERRINFSPTLWNKDPGRIKQYLFSGAHGDVGGGYPETESALSDIACKWTIDQLRLLGVEAKAWPQGWLPMVDAASHFPWLEEPFCLFPNAMRDWGGNTEYGLVEHETIALRVQKLRGAYNPQNRILA